MSPRLRPLALFLGLSLATASAFSQTAAEPAPVPNAPTEGIQLVFDTRLHAVIPSRPGENDLWQRLRVGMVMPDLDSPLVARHEAWFAAQPAFLDASFRRARLYLHHIVEEVEARGMPAELALLPLIESAYNPRAQSASNASGIWQFIPSTGRLFGLKQNGWYDGRQDVVTATHAALDYLDKLHTMFGNWELALAAYNCGEGCVIRAINRNQARRLPTDYASLPLPEETRNYVPRLLAVRNLIREPEHFGIRLVAMPNQPYFERVNLPYPIEARTAARLAGIDMDDLLDLNPGFRRHVLHAESQSSLFLPADRLAAFRANLAAEESQRIRMRTYSASKGELLTRIASQFDVSVQWLVQHNPLSTKWGKLAHPQTLLLPPSSSGMVATARPAAARSVVAQAAARIRTHTVRHGETLRSLARLYRVTVADIQEYNGAVKVLRPGTKLQIPVSG